MADAVDKKVKVPKPIERVFKGTQSFHHDLFKLAVAQMLKWVGFKKSSQEWYRDDEGNKNDEWLEMEHSHIFHTIDSSGKVLTYSAPVGGHFHKMEVIRSKSEPDKIIEVKCVSGPLKFEAKVRNGKRQKVAVPACNFDKHSHDTMYIRSDVIERGKLSAEAARVIGQEAAKFKHDVFDPETGKRLDSLVLR